MNAPFYSICIPNYNYGRYVGETIQSVLDQDFEDFEIVVADNASTDNSAEVVRSFGDPRVRLVENRYNIGFAPNLQRATMEARGRYVNLLSSDDQMKPGALRTYAQALEALGGDAGRAVLFSQAEVFDDSGQVTGLVRKAADGFYSENLRFSNGSSGCLSSHAAPPPASARRGGCESAEFERYDGRDVLRDSLSRLRTFAPFLTVVYARSLWESVEGYNAVRTIGPDKFFHYKLLSLDPVVAYLPRPLYRYRLSQSPNLATQFTTLKQVADDYLYTIEYSNAFLAELGLRREDLIRVFLERVCMRQGLGLLGRRQYASAFRLFCFGFAAYPSEALRIRRTWQLGALLALGPLAKVVAPILYRRRSSGVFAEFTG